MTKMFDKLPKSGHLFPITKLSEHHARPPIGGVRLAARANFRRPFFQGNWRPRKRAGSRGFVKSGLKRMLTDSHHGNQARHPVQPGEPVNRPPRKKRTT